ncbi:MAG TPA: hypothetical protein DD473_20040 [Planctomycetaceae bacterium]|nr:hypothetical protein [Planctomycetaceae bacterium]
MGGGGALEEKPPNQDFRGHPLTRSAPATRITFELLRLMLQDSKWIYETSLHFERINITRTI